MNIAIDVMIVNTQNALAVWIFAPSAFMRRQNLLGQHERTFLFITTKRNNRNGLSSLQLQDAKFWAVKETTSEYITPRKPYLIKLLIR